VKINAIIENVETNARKKTLADVFFSNDQGDGTEKKLITLNNFSVVAPDGKPRDKWEGSLNISDDLNINSLEGFPKVVEGVVVVRGTSTLKSLDGIGNAKIKSSLMVANFDFKNFQSLKNIEAREFVCSSCQVETFHGLPSIDKMLFGYCGISSYDGFPSGVKSLNIYSNTTSSIPFRKINLKNFSKNVAVTDLNLYFDVEGSILDIMKIKGLKKFDWTIPSSAKNPEQLRQALRIVTYGIEDSKNIFEVQEELINANLDEFFDMK
jgi:hypothetical protein